MTSWWLGTEPAVQSSGSQTMLTMGVIILAFIKVRLILFQFMEVRSAPRLLRRICDGWVVGMCILLLTLIGSLPERSERVGDFILNPCCVCSLIYRSRELDPSRVSSCVRIAATLFESTG